MPDTRAPNLPELARSLRSLGALRDGSSDAAHAAVFIPLLEARARAEGGSADVVLAALRGDALAARIEAQALDAAVHGVDVPSRARALSALTGELMEPLRAELLSLDAAALEARDDDASWQRWVAQLKRVFAAADVACQALAWLLASRDVGDKPRTRHWLDRIPR